jgi:hypothetical protein
MKHVYAYASISKCDEMRSLTRSPLTRRAAAALSINNRTKMSAGGKCGTDYLSLLEAAGVLAPANGGDAASGGSAAPAAAAAPRRNEVEVHPAAHGDGASSGGSGAAPRAKAGAPPRRNKVEVHEKPLAQLWAGYGSVRELLVTRRHSKSSSNSAFPLRLVAKAVDPPGGEDEKDAGHQRKLRSYAVEAAFYRAGAPRLAQLASSLGLDPYNPSAADDGGGGGDGALQGGGSWCWVPRPVALEAEPPRHFLFLLSDLRPAFPRQPRGYNLAEAKAALEWLASFHAAWWEETPPEGLWRDGCYWHLATRADELAQIEGKWGRLRDAAGAVDAALRGEFGSSNSNRSGSSGDEQQQQGRQGRPPPFTTLCHGDAKAANFLFSADGRRVAAYDFQYCGAGLGAKDVVYLIVSSVDGSLLGAGADGAAGAERALLLHYHAALRARLRALGKARAAEGYGFESALLPHYELALVDYCRFMAGWGWWGASRYAQARVQGVLARLPEVLAAAEAAAAAAEAAAAAAEGASVAAGGGSSGGSGVKVPAG